MHEPYIPAWLNVNVVTLPYGTLASDSVLTVMPVGTEAEVPGLAMEWAELQNTRRNCIRVVGIAYVSSELHTCRRNFIRVVGIHTCQHKERQIALTHILE